MSTTTSHHDAPQPFPENDDAHDESVPQRELRTLVGGSCRECGASYTAREAVFSIFLGLKNAPRCLVCASRRLERDAVDLQADLLAHIRRRDCYWKAWQEAECLDGVAGTSSAHAAAGTRPDAAVTDGAEPVTATAEWDAGDMGCGELVMALRMRLKGLQGGDVMRVTATDPAAPEDLPAWCRLCGHTLVAMRHPNYWIRRKGD